jgi:hypothetical protein
MCNSQELQNKKSGGLIIIVFDLEDSLFVGMPNGQFTT